VEQGRKSKTVNIPEIFSDGGIMMYPLTLASIVALSVIIERAVYWWKTLTHEREVSGRVLEAAQRDWEGAAEIARKSTQQPIGRFLNSAMELKSPEPEVFQLALEAAADEELVAMQRGDKVLEAIIAIAPMLGLLGTVVGLIESLGGITFGDLGTSSAANVTSGISEALYTTAYGLIVAVISLVFYRIFQGFISGQAKAFRKYGNELELLYRQNWAAQNRERSPSTQEASDAPSTVESHG
jgi:biopolymer transport protein ExbB